LTISARNAPFENKKKAKKNMEEHNNLALDTLKNYFLGIFRRHFLLLDFCFGLGSLAPRCIKMLFFRSEAFKWFVIIMVEREKGKTKKNPEVSSVGRSQKTDILRKEQATGRCGSCVMCH
jgi:hypothetical protein